VNTVVMFFSANKETAVLAPSSKVAGGGRVRRVWNTRTNHGRAQERRVCVISGTSHGTLPLRWQTKLSGGTRQKPANTGSAAPTAAHRPPTMAGITGIGGDKFSGKPSDWPDTKTEIIGWLEACGYS
jgi:hypothetical protein